MPQLPEEKSGQTSGRERELRGAGRWGCDLRLLLRSWSGDLDFFPLGTGWAALFSLLVVYRAGMANRASAKPGEQRRETWAGFLGEHLPVLLVCQGSLWLAQDASLFPQAVLTSDSRASIS